MTSIEYTYHNNGTIFEMISKNENGKLDGVQKGYHLNGQLWYEQCYENGLKEGIQKEYYINDQLRYEYYCENGRLIWQKEY